MISISRQLIKEHGTFATSTPEIMFEFEAYLFQCKALLDILSQVIGDFFDSHPSNIRKLKHFLLNKKENRAFDLLKLLEKNNWLKEFDSSDNFKKSKRDIVAHYSNIEISAMNIQKLDAKRFNTIRTKVEEKYVIDYVWYTSRKIRKFVLEALKIVENNQKL